MLSPLQPSTPSVLTGAPTYWVALPRLGTRQRLGKVETSVVAVFVGPVVAAIAVPAMIVVHVGGPHHKDREDGA